MASDDSRLIRRHSAVPIWRQIETDLAVEIRSGLLAPGDKLPTEQELSERYRVNRHTVRYALGRLADDGLIRSQRGKGVFVEDEPIEYPLTKDTKWSELERLLASEPAGSLIDVMVRRASHRLSRLLEIEEGAELVVTETVRSAGIGLACYGYHMFPKVRFDGIEASFERTSSFTEALALHGVNRFFRRSTWIDCRMPRAREAEALGIDVDRPVIEMAYVDCDEGGVPILYGQAILPGGAVRIRVDTA